MLILCLTYRTFSECRPMAELPASGLLDDGVLDRLGFEQEFGGELRARQPASPPASNR
jgi:hypothetical protein